jgi:hypothetical protein
VEEGRAVNWEGGRGESWAGVDNEHGGMWFLLICSFPVLFERCGQVDAGDFSLEWRAGNIGDNVPTFIGHHL